MSPKTKAQQKATNKYMKNNYDRIGLIVPKGQKEAVQAHAEKRRESLNGFVSRAIKETMERDIASGGENNPTEGGNSDVGEETSQNG